MIIFTPIHDIPDEYLLYKGIGQVVKFNLSSYYNDAINMNSLIPDFDGYNYDYDTPQFDIDYHNYIFNNQEAFIQFMNIIIPAYMDPSVLVQVLIKSSNYRDILTESLCKLIQQRYGYNVCIINELDDLLYAEESDFSIPGLFILDQDIAKWNSFMNYNVEECDYE